MEGAVMETRIPAIVNITAGLLLCPLLPGIINRTKAFFAGRQGPPLLQAYHDIIKLLGKGAVYSRTTTWIFRAGPIIGIAAGIAALALLPLAGAATLVSFTGDVVLLAGLLCLMRFFTVIAALDTGSSFEGMGASREVLFSALAEPVLLVGLAAVMRQTHAVSLTDMLPRAPGVSAEILLFTAALFIIFLCENARIPFDDPNTHLELTMIHEVMVLDHGGPDFALITYGSALKLWIFGGLIVGMTVPQFHFHPAADLGLALLGLGVLSLLTGTVESVMARLRLTRVPQLLIASAALTFTAFLFALD